MQIRNSRWLLQQKVIAGKIDREQESYIRGSVKIDGVKIYVGRISPLEFSGRMGVLLSQSAAGSDER